METVEQTKMFLNVMADGDGAQEESVKKVLEIIELIQAEQNKAFQVLEMYGIPKERARSVDNGIMVFDSRMQKEVKGLRFSIESLQADKANLEADRIFDASKIKRLETDKAELVKEYNALLQIAEANTESEFDRERGILAKHSTGGRKDPVAATEDNDNEN